MRSTRLTLAALAAAAFVGCGGSGAGDAPRQPFGAASQDAADVTSWNQEDAAGTPVRGGSSPRQAIARRMVEERSLNGATRAQARASLGEPYFSTAARDDYYVGVIRRRDLYCVQVLQVTYEGRSVADTRLAIDGCARRPR